jgi:outer membrane protein insertion porin family
MIVRYLIRRVPGAAFLLALEMCAGPTVFSRAADVRPSDFPSNSSAIQDKRASNSTGTIHRIEFRGLRRIPAATLRPRLISKEGEPLDATRIEEDVRSLDRLGWFDTVSAEVEEIPVLLASAEPTAAPVDPLLRLVFVVEERPFLAGIEYKGSRVLSRDRVSRLLAEKGIALKLAAPVNRNDLWRAARAIETELTDERHPLAKVSVRLDELPSSASVRATLEIRDGPEVTVSAVTFTGNRAFSQAKLQRQMKRVAPDALLAGLRRKDVYSSPRLEADLQRLAEFYRNNGYPEARIGKPVTAIASENVRHWLPWPHRRAEPRFRIAIPVQEGHFYRLTAVEVRRANPSQGETGGDGGDAAEAERLVARLGLRTDQPYSQAKLEHAREVLTHLRELRPPDAPSLAPDVAVTPRFDPADGTVKVAFDVREAQPYTIRRIEFHGEQRFSDRYYRRRVLVAEGEPFDPERLERGLAQLARTGFIRPVKREDIRTQFDETQRAVDLSIRVQEIGRQKISLIGGHSPFGSTVGLVYNVFDLLGGEELITSHLEGSPESLQILLGIAKDGFFGTKLSLGLSLYRNVVKPTIARHQRLFTSANSGFGANWNYPVSPADTLGASYQLSSTSTRYGVLVPTALAGLPGSARRVSTSSSMITLSDTHETPQDRILSSVGASGGWLGGNENLVRSTIDYSRVFSSNSGPAAARHNAWAFRGFFSGVSSFRGDMPLSSRLFAGNDLVRGAGTSELGPSALTKTQNADGTTAYRADPAGANLVGAVSTEYRVPITSRAQAAAFFDAGGGWLLTNWLGPDKPALAGGDHNLTAATGLELKWLVPGIGQTVRIHYSINPFHIRRSVLISDGGVAIPVALSYRRRSGLGWALGDLF